MALMVVRGVDLLAVAAAVGGVGMTLVYRAVIDAQGEDDPLLWVQALLVGGALMALAGAPTGQRHRVALLFAAAGLMGVVGLLALLTIGFPILVAALLAALAGLRKPALHPSQSAG